MVKRQRFVLAVALLFALTVLAVPAAAGVSSSADRSESGFVRVMQISDFIGFKWVGRWLAWAAAGGDGGAGMDPDGTPADGGAGMDPDGSTVDGGAGMDPDGTPVEGGAGMDPDGNN